MLFELLSIFTTLPLVSSPLPVTTIPWHRFWGPYVTLGISIVFHGAWCKGSRERRGRRMTPLRKKHMANKIGDNNYWTSRFVFFCGTFLQCSSFCGVEDFRKYQMADVFLMAFSKPWKFVPLDDARRNWHPYNPWSRSTRSRLVDQGREGQNGWRWKSMKFEIRLSWMRKLGVFVSKTFWCWSLWFFGGRFLISTHLMMCTCR